jgi:hypothetical protein
LLLSENGHTYIIAALDKNQLVDVVLPGKFTAGTISVLQNAAL